MEHGGAIALRQPTLLPLLADIDPIWLLADGSVHDGSCGVPFILQVQHALVVLRRPARRARRDTSYNLIRAAKHVLGTYALRTNTARLVKLPATGTPAATTVRAAPLLVRAPRRP